MTMKNSLLFLFKLLNIPQQCFFLQFAAQDETQTLSSSVKVKQPFLFSDLHTSSSSFYFPTCHDTLWFTFLCNKFSCSTFLAWQQSWNSSHATVRAAYNGHGKTKLLDWQTEVLDKLTFLLDDGIRWKVGGSSKSKNTVEKFYRKTKHNVFTMVLEE